MILLENCRGSLFSQNDGRLDQWPRQQRLVSACFGLLEEPLTNQRSPPCVQPFCKKIKLRSAALPSLQTCSFFLVQWTGKL